jgi:hypothetical protein
MDIYRLIVLADTVMIPSSEVLEKESIAYFRKWYESLGKSVWIVGPPNPAEDHAAVSRVSLPNPEDEKVMAFLDRIHNTHGDRSIVFVRVFTSIILPSA